MSRTTCRSNGTGTVCVCGSPRFVEAKQCLDAPEFDRRGNMPEKAYQYFQEDHTNCIYPAFCARKRCLVSDTWLANPHAPRAHRLGRYAGLGPQKHGFSSCAFYVGVAGRGTGFLSDGGDG